MNVFKALSPISQTVVGSSFRGSFLSFFSFRVLLHFAPSLLPIFLTCHNVKEAEEEEEEEEEEEVEEAAESDERRQKGEEVSRDISKK